MSNTNEEYSVDESESSSEGGLGSVSESDSFDYEEERRRCVKERNEEIQRNEAIARRRRTYIGNKDSKWTELYLGIGSREECPIYLVALNPEKGFSSEQETVICSMDCAELEVNFVENGKVGMICSRGGKKIAKDLQNTIDEMFE